MFRQVYVVLVASITISVFVDSKTVHLDHSLGIINGQEATPHEAKSMVRLNNFIEEDGKKIYFAACGGTLISDRYVLSAKHCARDMDGTVAIIGGHDKLNVTQDEIRIVYKTENTFIEHPEVDLLLVKLGSPVTFNDKINKTSLPLKKDANETYVGQTGTAFGWGRISDNATHAQKLRKVDVTVISNDQCKEELSKIFNIYGPETYQLCTSGNGSNNPRGICDGDSGGPFYIDDVLVGVIVAGTRYCEDGGPSIYISTGQFLKWIGENTGIDFP